MPLLLSLSLSYPFSPSVPPSLCVLSSFYFPSSTYLRSLCSIPAEWMYWRPLSASIAMERIKGRVSLMAPSWITWYRLPRGMNSERERWEEVRRGEKRWEEVRRGEKRWERQRDYQWQYKDQVVLHTPPWTIQCLVASKKNLLWQ